MVEETEILIEKEGEGKMRIGVTYGNGEIFQHFGHTSQFKLYEVENGEIKGTQIIDTNGQGHGALASFLTNAGVEVLICGGIGGGAQNALASAGIQLYGGVSGDESAKGVDCSLYNQLFNQILLFPYFSLTLSCLNF